MFHLYGLVVGMAVVAGWSVAERIEPRTTKVLPWVLGLALIGARLYHVIDLWDYYSQNQSQIVAIWNGGLGIWGGIMGGGVGVVMYQRINKLSDNWVMLGAIVTGLPLGQAIGRVANGVNGEFVNMIGPMPWWSLEAMLDFGLFVFMWIYPRGRTPRQLVGMYLVGYGVIRFGLEFFKIDSWMMGGLGVAHWMALSSIVLGLYLCQQRSVRD